MFLYDCDHGSVCACGCAHGFPHGHYYDCAGVHGHVHAHALEGDHAGFDDFDCACDG